MKYIGENGNLAQRIADAISRQILETGEFKPGQKIPNENELSEKFGVSRSTLREAIKTLSASGILVVRRGCGTFVADSLPEKGGLTLPELKRMKVELKDLNEVRTIFEPKVAALACSRASDEELRQISGLEMEIERRLLAGEDTTDTDIAFHTAILKAAHNEFFLQIAPVVRQALSDQRILKASENLIKSVLPDHALIMEFLMKRDAPGTESAVRIHLHRLTEALQEG
ncbi:MAG: FadR family transcriptional regulator [Clostridia bacterium]|nr:FadR family transcriptional regulator [Clostridia bacterium]NCC69063.1 FadR family transcriptional regulator [Clostridia bacterium]